MKKVILNLIVVIAIFLFASCSFIEPSPNQLEQTGALVDVDLDDNNALDLAYGGTNATSASEAQTNLSIITNPMTTQYDMIYGGLSGVPSRLSPTNDSFIGWNTSGVLAGYDSFAFGDNDYQFYDTSESTRQLQLILDGVTANNKRRVTIQDKDGTMALLEGITGTISTDTVLEADQCYGTTWYINADGTQVTLAAVAEGMNTKFLTVGNIHAIVAPNANDLIFLDGVSLDDEDAIDNDSTAGDWAELAYYSADGWYAKTNGWNDDDAPSTSCQVDYSPSVSDDQNFSIGFSTYTDFRGILYTPSSGEEICSIDLYIRSISGTLTSSHDYYCRIFAIDGSDQAVTVLGTSNVVPGESMVGGTWVSENAGAFGFSSSVSLTGSTTYAITFFIDRDGNLNDDPEADTTNYPNAGYEDESIIDSIGGGRIGYLYNPSLPYAVQTQDEDDDVKLKVHTIQ